MSFCTVVNCIDGRVQLAVISYMMARCDADHVDNITESGVVAILSEGDDNPITESICEKIKLSVDAHKSRTVAVVGHYDCKANPVSDSVQLRQIGKSAKYLACRFGALEILGLWVDQAGEVTEVVTLGTDGPMAG